MATTLRLWRGSVGGSAAVLAASGTRPTGAWPLKSGASATSLNAGWRIATPFGNGVLNVVSVTSQTGPRAGTAALEAGAYYISAPVDQDFTMAGTITATLWALESSMNANAAIGCRILKISRDGTTVTLVGDGFNGTELGTASASRAISITPTSTAFQKGDRIGFTYYFTDATATTMAAGFSLDMRAGATSGGVDGDSNLVFTETFGLMETAPAGSTVYFQNTASPVGGFAKEAWTSRGSGVQSAVTRTVAGPTAGVQITDTANGNALDWYTKPLAAFTLSGPVQVNFRGFGPSFQPTATVVAVISITNADGSGAVEWGRTRSLDYLNSTEDAVDNWVVVGPDTSVAANKRIRIRFLYDDMDGANSYGNMSAGLDLTFRYAGTSANASGDSWVKFGQTLTEYTIPGFIFPGSIDTAESVGTPTVEKAYTTKWFLSNHDADIRSFGLDSPKLSEQILRLASQQGTLVQSWTMPTVAGPTAGVQLSTDNRAPYNLVNMTWGNIVVLQDGTMFWFAESQLQRRDPNGHIHPVAGYLQSDSSSVGSNSNDFVLNSPTRDGFGSDVGLDYPPSGSCVDSTETYLWFVDGEQMRRYVIATGEVQTVTNLSTAAAAAGVPDTIVGAYLAIDSTDTYIYLGNRLFNRIWRYTIADGTMTPVCGDGSWNPQNPFTTGTGTAASVGYVLGLALSLDDTTLYALCHFGGVLKHTILAQISVSSLPGTVSLLAGNTGGTYSEGTGSAAGLIEAMSLSIDSAGTLYFVDGENLSTTPDTLVHRLRKCVPSTAVVSSVAGNGVAADLDGTGTGARLWLPLMTGIKRGTTSPIYVGSYFGRTLRQITSGGVSTKLHGYSGGFNGVPYFDMSTNGGDGPTSWMTPQLASATIPAATPVTIHVWASESNVAANVALRARLQRCNRLGVVVSTIADSTSTIELGTSMAAIEFTITTGAEVVLSNGDRLKLTLFLDDDDSGSMAAGHTVTFNFGSNPAAQADTWIAFDSLTLTEYTARWVAPAKWYLTNDAATVTADSFSTTNKRVASTTPGASAQSRLTAPGVHTGHTGNSVTGTRVGWQFTSSSPYSWWTPGLAATTLYAGDQIRARFWAFESVATMQASIGLRVTLVSSTGVAKNFVGHFSCDRELGTAVEQYDFLVTVESDIAVAEGDRLMISPGLGESPAVVSRGLGGGIQPSNSYTFYWNGPDDASAANSFVQFESNVAISTGGQTIGVLGLITSTASAYAPTLLNTLQFLTLGLITSVSDIYAPTIINGGQTVEIPLGLIDSGSAIYAPSFTFSYDIALGLIDASPAIYDVSVVLVQFIALARLESEPTVYILSAYKVTEDDPTRYGDRAGDGRYLSEGQAIHVDSGSFSVEPSTVVDSPVYLGQSAKIHAHPNSPPQWDYESVTQLPVDFPIYQGKSDAIHVFGDQHTPGGGAPPPIEACECTPDFEGGTDIDGVFDNFYRTLSNGWGTPSPYQKDGLESHWDLHNWAGLYYVETTGGEVGFTGEGKLFAYNVGGYVGMRARPLIDPDTNEFVPYSVPWTNYGNHFTMRIHLRGQNTTQNHSVYFGIMDGEDGDWEWQEWFQVAWNAGGNPLWNDWIVAWEVVAMQYARAKYWRPLMEPEPTNWMVFKAADLGDTLFDTDWHLFLVAEYPGVRVDWITYAYDGMDCVECEDPYNPGFQIPDFTPGYMPIFRPQIGDPQTRLDSYICTMESGAMVLDWHTRGAIQVWGGDLVQVCGRSEETIIGLGTNLGNLKTAWAYYGQHLDVRSGQTWADLMECLSEGRAVVLQGDYGVFTLAERCQDSLVTGHAISVYPYQQSGRLLVGDPICNDFKGFLETSLQEYAEALGASVYGSQTPQPILFAVSRPWTP